MSEHKFPANLADKSSAACANGCGAIARQLRYSGGLGDVEYFAGTERTGPRAGDMEGVWTTKAPACEVKS